MPCGARARSTRDALALIEGAVTRGALSARAFDRIARVARTIADLAGDERIGRPHVAEALALSRNVRTELSANRRPVVATDRNGERRAYGVERGMTSPRARR